QRNLSSGHQQRAVRVDIAVFKPHAGVNALFEAEPHGLRTNASRIGDSRCVVGIQYGPIAGLLGFEQAALGLRVSFEGMVTIEVVGRDVETDTDAGTEAANCFELETR